MKTIFCWMLQIKYVKGIDLSPGEIEEARRRFAEHVERRNPRQQGRSWTCTNSHVMLVKLCCLSLASRFTTAQQ